MSTTADELNTDNHADESMLDSGVVRTLLVFFAVLMFAAVVLYGCTVHAGDDLDDWLRRQAAQPACVYVFTSRSCSVCPRQQVQLDWLTTHGGWVNTQKGTGIKAHFVVVDADGFPDMVNWYGVSALPTMIAVRGDKVVERHEGLLNSDALRALWWKAKGK